VASARPAHAAAATPRPAEDDIGKGEGTGNRKCRRSCSQGWGAPGRRGPAPSRRTVRESLEEQVRGEKIWERGSRPAKCVFPRLLKGGWTLVAPVNKVSGSKCNLKVNGPKWHKHTRLGAAGAFN